MEIRSRDDSVPILYIIRAFKIILRYDRINARTALAYDREILSTCGRIFRPDAIAQAFLKPLQARGRDGVASTGSARVLRDRRPQGAEEAEGYRRRGAHTEGFSASSQEAWPHAQGVGPRRSLQR